MGNYLEDLFNKVFKQSGNKGLSHKENFDLSLEEIAHIASWSETEEAKSIFHQIYTNYHFKKAGINERPQVHLFSSQYANGFAITFEEPLNKDSFSNLFLTLANRVLALGYKQVSLDRKMEEKEDKVIQTEKFYFKPPLQIPEEGALISQLFGNVALEKIVVDNQPSYLKMLVTVYSDRLYQDAWSFDEMMDKLFEKTDAY